MFWGLGRSSVLFGLHLYVLLELLVRTKIWRVWDGFLGGVFPLGFLWVFPYFHRSHWAWDYLELFSADVHFESFEIIQMWMLFLEVAALFWLVRINIIQNLISRWIDESQFGVLWTDLTRDLIDAQVLVQLGPVAAWRSPFTLGSVDLYPPTDGFLWKIGIFGKHGYPLVMSK